LPGANGPNPVGRATLKHEKRLADMLWPAKSRLQPGLAAPQEPPAKEYSTRWREFAAQGVFSEQRV